MHTCMQALTLLIKRKVGVKLSVIQTCYAEKLYTFPGIGIQRYILYMWNFAVLSIQIFKEMIRSTWHLALIVEQLANLFPLKDLSKMVFIALQWKMSYIHFTGHLNWDRNLNWTMIQWLYLTLNFFFQTQERKKLHFNLHIMNILTVQFTTGPIGSRNMNSNLML